MLANLLTSALQGNKGDFGQHLCTLCCIVPSLPTLLHDILRHCQTLTLQPLPISLCSLMHLLVCLSMQTDSLFVHFPAASAHQAVLLGEKVGCWQDPALLLQTYCPSCSASQHNCAPQLPHFLQTQLRPSCLASHTVTAIKVNSKCTQCCVQLAKLVTERCFKHPIDLR